MRGLDNWITGGRYSSDLLDVTCSACETVTAVKQESEYGMTTWTPPECPKCNRDFDDETVWEEAEPPYNDEPDDIPDWDGS